MVKLLPGYEHDIERGAGLSVGPGRVKVVAHTTESPRGSYNAVRNLWRGPNNWGRGLPHFLADGSRYVQLLPLDVGGYTLENAPGGADTNRSGPAIQVEICTYSARGLDAIDIDAFAHWMADLILAGLDIDLSQHPTFYGLDAGFTLATYNARQRMSGIEYTAFGGFCGHQHTPENAHWDPGKLDGHEVERIARQYLGGFPPPPPPPEDPMNVMPAYEMSDGSIYSSDGLTATWLFGGTARSLQYPPDHPTIKVVGKLNRQDSIDFIRSFEGSRNIPIGSADRYEKDNPA